MQSLFHSHVPEPVGQRVGRRVGRVGFAGAAGALVSVLMLSGCPGTLDPSQFGSGSGGSTATGGSTGTGGAAANNCTGDLDGATLVMTQCAISGCHDATDANTLGAGLDLTVDSSIGSRLVGVVSPGDTNASSVCGGNTEPYLVSGSNPATGLLVQKIQTSPKCATTESPPCCGTPMPYPGIVLLSVQQQNCLIQWATTLTSP
jgi:hypothetical protein